MKENNLEMEEKIRKLFKREVKSKYADYNMWKKSILELVEMPAEEFEKVKTSRAITAFYHWYKAEQSK